MKRLIHPNVVRVLAAESRPLPPEGVEILVVMEMCPGGHLLTRLNALRESKKVLPWQKVLDVFLQIVKPVAAMHALEPEPVAHRDLKFENVLIAADGTLRLCDFGSSSSHRGTIADKTDRAEQEDAILRYTTPHFRSPEMVDLYSGLPLDVRSDVWALGCMLYGLAYWSHPFQEGGNLAILAARYKLPTSPAYPPPIHTLIRACLQYRPEERPTASQIIAYCEACLKVGAEAGGGPWPVLHTSGGNSVHSAAIPPPTPGSEQGLPDGSVMITGNSDSSTGASAATGGGGGAASRYHAPTAQDILQQVQAQSLANAAATSSKSGALAARLARKGGAPTQPPVSAPAPAPAPAAQLQHQPQQPQAAAAPRTGSFSSAPAPAPLPAAGFDGFDAFGASSGPRAPSPAAPVPSAHAPGGPTHPAHSAGAGFDDFDVFGASSAGPAPAASAARPASGGGLGFDLPVAAPVHAPVPAPAPAPAPAASDFDDFFSSSGSSSKGGSDLLGMGSSSGAGAVVGSGGGGLGDAFGGLSLGPTPHSGGAVKQQAAVRPQPAAPSPMDDPFNF